MSSTLIISETTTSPIIVTENTTDDDTVHYVCHCRDDNWSWCGLDMEGEPWNDGDDVPCPLCELARDLSGGCPWGCECWECE